MPINPPGAPRESGPCQAAPQLTVVDVHALVSEVAAQLAQLAAQHAVQVNVGPPAATRHALADRPRLRQVLLKVLGNAIKYNRKHGRVDIRLSMIGRSDVAIAVSDTGGGLADGDIGRLFDPCALTALACAAQQEGTPCLARARASARAMRGDVVVASAVGVGSTFVVSLPAAATLNEPRG